MSNMTSATQHCFELGYCKVVLIACFAAACSHSAQVTGTVNEIEGGPLPGVQVTIDGLKTHAQSKTDTTGRFEFQNLAAGTYSVKAELADYVAESKQVAVAGGQATKADFTIHPACLEEGSYVDGG